MSESALSEQMCLIISSGHGSCSRFEQEHYVTIMVPLYSLYRPALEALLAQYCCSTLSTLCAFCLVCVEQERADWKHVLFADCLAHIWKRSCFNLAVLVLVEGSFTWFWSILTLSSDAPSSFSIVRRPSLAHFCSAEDSETQSGGAEFVWFGLVSLDEYGDGQIDN